jgi:hypothetical protein
MRRSQDDALHLRVGEGVFQVGGQPEAMFGRQIARKYRLLLP